MPYGFKRDVAATKVLRTNHFFQNPKSFITLPDLAGEIHLKLFGLDLSAQRHFVYTRSRGKCAECRQVVTEGCAELDHKQGGLSGRCDCLHNLQIFCVDCHVKKHGRFPRFGEGRAEAVKDFERINKQ